MAFLGPHLVRWINPKANIDAFLMLCIGFALLVGATAYALQLYVQLRRRAKGLDRRGNDPIVRPLPPILVGPLHGLLVAVTSLGSGSSITLLLLILYPTIPTFKRVGSYP